MEQVAPKETTDRLVVYRNLLLAEDHLEEMLDTAQTKEELEWMENVLKAIQGFRSAYVRGKEKDDRFHCLMKHMAAAYEASREVEKISGDAQDRAHRDAFRQIYRMVAERVYGGKVNLCARCKDEHHNSSE